MQCVIPFSGEEEKALFNQFINQEHLVVEDGLVEELHEFTGGYFCSF
jgi:hypothetical protein